MITKLKNNTIIFLLLAVGQIFNSSCSKRIQPELSSVKAPVGARNKKPKDLKYTDAEKETNTLIPFNSSLSIDKIDSHGEDSKLKYFLKAGYEKKTDVKGVKADELIKTAKKYLGVPHCMGGKSMKCIDCSGLLVAVFASYDIRLPHNSEEQARYGKIIASKTELREGDLVFFIKSYRTQNFITHSGIYIGNNKFIHTSSSKGVIITSLDDEYWKQRYIFGTRLLK
jgi:cell wall-associated NlpC family hydrolase